MHAQLHAPAVHELLPTYFDQQPADAKEQSYLISAIYLYSQ